MTQGRTLEESERLIAKFERLPGAKAVKSSIEVVFVFIQPDELKGLLEWIRLKAWTRQRAKAGDQQSFEDFYL